MLQATIDERRDVIERLIEEVPRLIHNQFKDYEQEAKITAADSCDGDNDIYLTIYHNTLAVHNPDDEEWMIGEIYRSLVLLIVSFAETTIQKLLNNPKQKFKGNYLESAYNQVNKEKCLNLKSIDCYWKSRNTFINIRRNIAHQQGDVPINKQLLLDGLSGAHHLLRTVADAIDTRINNNKLMVKNNN